MNKIRVRFAPSPTGYLHVGGARTAIYNYLFAKKNDGKFYLRIEDTDKERSSSSMVEQIINSLNWLGLQADGEIYFQSDHDSEHRKLVEELLKRGKAYRCFCSPEEIKAKKEAAIKEKRSDKYDRTCLKLTPREIEENLEQGKPFAVRLKIEEGMTSFDDPVLGKITVNNENIDDFIIARRDGSPVYHLAVVHDDHQMGISHVIRGNDHLSNTAKQIQIYKAMQWPIPYFAHLPLITGTDKKRLSKRHGAASIEEFKDKGILPEALFNYLALLGWSPSGDKDIFSVEELIELFALNNVNKNSAVFDEKKLFWMNGEYVSQMSAEELWERLSRFEAYEEYRETDKEYLLQVIELLKSRLKTPGEFFSRGFYFFKAPEKYDSKGIKKYFKDQNTKERLQKLIDKWQELKEFTAEGTENVLRELCAAEEISAAKLIHPVRLIVTGATVSPSLFEVLQLIGKHEIIKRIEHFIENYENLITAEEAD